MAWTANIPVRLTVGDSGDPIDLGHIVITSAEGIPRLDHALAEVLRQAADRFEANAEGVPDAAAHQ
ncbi:hypothetical protein [Streptomyces sp. NPDC020983]|uniref:hypothetical protein n=1 Tax=Streptomyces sp. NPDC020983 TaxID=3365106 RepID=UPI00378FF2C2